MRVFPSKVVLFGEYVIIRGARALAIPYHDFGGHWAFSPSGVEDERLLRLASHLEKLAGKGQLLAALDLDRFRSDLSKGLHFDSSIPEGYGLGSSGALVAALYATYASSAEDDPRLLRSMLAQIESFFHGSSSGVDPLVCLLDQPLLLRSSKEVEVVRVPVSEPEGKGGLFLVDTGLSRETGPLVRIFLSKCENLDFDVRVEEELGSLSNASIQAFLKGDWRILLPAFSAISQFQWEYFREMIPASFHQVWEAGLESPHYKLKLCGAGGGGFLLGISSDLEAARAALPGQTIRLLHSWKNV